MEQSDTGVLLSGATAPAYQPAWVLHFPPYDDSLKDEGYSLIMHSS